MTRGRKAGRFWTWLKVNRVIRRYPVEGASEALAEACGCTVATLIAKAGELGLKPPKKPRPAKHPPRASAAAAPPGKVKLTAGAMPASRKFIHASEVAGLPAASREPDCPREEARRARARQLARVLAPAPLSRFSLGDAGWRHAEAEILRGESPEWFAFDGCEWSLTPAGRAALLAAPAVIIDAKQERKRKARAA